MSPDGTDVKRPPAVAVVTPDGDLPSWTGRAGPAAELARIDPGGGDEALGPCLERTTAIFIDGDVEAPLSVARGMNRLAPGAHLTIVAEESDHARLRRSRLFTPGIGEVWIRSPREVTAELVGQAAAIGRTRRSHSEQARKVASEVAALVASPGRRPFLADQYLATLLELLPDPVLALDEGGSVIFANPRAAGMLGVERRATLTADELRLRLDPADPGAWDALLERGCDEVARAHVESRVEGTRQVFDVAVAPVSGERPVRAVILHEVTNEVEAREALQRQAVRLEEQSLELQQTNEELEVQAEELEVQAEEMGAQAEEIRSAMHHRNRFYASMSHELRTPINAILGYSELIGDEIYGSVPPAQKEALDRIDRAARHLLDLVNDVLDLSKVEAGKIQVHPEPLDVSELVLDLEATMQPLADENDVLLRFAIEESCAGNFSTDPRRLRQILMNLLSNAIRYGAGAPVDVSCQIGDGRLCTEVEDHGPGISAADAEHIFDEFVQLGNGDKGGTGLGLAISRAMARSLGGELSLESEEGKGSVFRVEVPWLEEEPAEEP